MSLTIGDAPFGRRPGTFNFTRSGPDRVLYVEDSPRWVRGIFAGETVVSSRAARLVHETGHLPVYYFPPPDVRSDLLVPTEHTSHCPLKGDASYWTVRVGESESVNAAWSYPEPIAGAEALAGLIAFYWRKLDHWYEEDEEVFVHARDPFHRVDVLATSRRVKVSRGGVVLAETDRSVVLFETGLPPRYYIPTEDVRTELLNSSESHTDCPYKGTASYWNVQVGDETLPDFVWTYPEPIDETAKIAGRLCFYNEKVDLEIDGELAPRPTTRWS